MNGNLTTAANVSTFQVGTAVALDKGYLTFSDVTLKVYSDAVPVTAVDDYHLNAQINGNVTQTHSGTTVQMRVGLTAVLVCVGAADGW